MPDKFDPKEFLRSRGVTPSGEGDQPATPEKPSYAPPETPSEAPAEPSPEGEENRWYSQAFRGGMRGLAGLASQAIRLAPYASPITTFNAEDIGEYLQNRPWVQGLNEFAEEPSQSWPETIGYGAGTIAGTAAIPGVGAEALAERGATALASRYGPKYLSSIGEWVRSPAQRQIERLMQRYFRPTSRAIDRAAAGAAGGALGSPDDPATGALGGAVAGAALPGAQSVLRTQTARKLGQHLLPSGIAALAQQHLTGVSPWLAWPMIHQIRWLHQPTGERLGRMGQWIVDESGKIVGVLPGGTAGYYAGAPVGAATRSVAEEGARAYENSNQ